MAPGVDVIISQYCFAIYPHRRRALFGANPIIVPAKNYGHDLPAMLAAITPQTKVIFVANPNNPTGTLAPREDVAPVCRSKCRERVLLAMDEAYIEFLDEPVDLLPMIRARRKAQSAASCGRFPKFSASPACGSVMASASRI